MLFSAADVVLSLFFLLLSEVPIRVFYLDRSSHGGNQDDTDVATTHDFSPSGCFPGVFYVTLLYRPGHYDLVYNRSEGMLPATA